MKRNDFLFLLISSVILVVAWIIFNIIHQSVTSTITETVSSDILPIPGTFDQQTINALKSRIVISPDYSVANVASGQAAIANTPTPTLSFANTVATTSSPIASQGGKLQ